MPRFRSKLTVRVVPVVLVGFAVSTGFSVQASSQAETAAARERGTDITRTVAAQVEARTSAVQQALNSLAATATGVSGADRRVLQAVVAEFARTASGVIHAYIVYEPGKAPGPDAPWLGSPFLSGDGHFYVAYQRGGDTNSSDAPVTWFTYSDSELAQALAGDWYRVPMETGSPQVSEPRVDPSTHILTTSLSAPILDSDRKPVGVAGVDVRLDDLSTRIAGTSVGRQGYAMLLSALGTILAVPASRLPDRTALGTKTLARAAPPSARAATADLLAHAASQSEGSIMSDDPLGAEPALINWTSIPSTGWRLLTVIPESEIAAPVVNLRNRLVLVALGVVASVTLMLLIVAARLTRDIPKLRDAALCLARGDLDVVHPPVSDDEIGEVSRAFGAIVNYLQAARERTSNFAQVQALADIDGLTGLLNRRRFNELAEAVVDSGRLDVERPGVGHALLVMIDIDHFKSVNDTWGHPTGDDVIAEVARRLSRQVRSTDVLGRYGGEEFSLLLVSNNGSGLPADLPERLRCSVADDPIVTRTGEIRVTISVGVAVVTSIDGLAGAIERADRALYQSKQDGRNRVHLDSLP